jgi:glycosyltransferase involved in cell wall biosynthesis
MNNHQDPTDQPVRVLIVSSHPIQYNSPIYRRYAEDPRLSVTVAYCSLQGAVRGFEPDFGVEISWDVPLLDGYNWIHVRNWSPSMSAERMLGLVNPGLWPVIRRGRFDVVVVYGYRTASFWIATLAARASGSAVMLASDAHSVSSMHGNAWKLRLKSVLLPWLVRSFDGVLVPSTAASSYARSLGIAADAVLFAPYVIDNDFFRERSNTIDRHQARTRLKIPVSATLALFSGKLIPRKRPQDLLLAASRLDNVHVAFAGDGILRDELKRTAEVLGVTSRVHFLGFINQTELPIVYRAADVLVLPSDREPFGLVVNEAFACGVPAIVSTACGSAGDLVREGLTGYVVPVGDIEALARRLGIIDAQPELRHQMAQRAGALLESWGPSQNAARFAEACLAMSRHVRRGQGRRPA